MHLPPFPPDLVESLLAGVTEGVIVWNAAGRVIACNSAAERMLDLSRQELVGRAAAELRLDLVDSTGAPIPDGENPIDVMLRRMDGTESELGFRGPDGVRVWVRASCLPLRDASATVVGAMSTWVDVTSLREDARRLRDVTAGANVGTWELDRDTGKATRSDRWFALLNLRREDVEPSFDGLRPLVHPEDLHLLESIPPHWDQGTMFRYEMRLRTGNGEWRWFQVRGRAVSGTAGARRVIAGVLVDVDERKRTELALHASLEENVRLVEELRTASAKVQALEGLLSICMYCKAIRNEDDWVRLETYITQRSRADFTHGICPSCYAAHHADD